MLKVEVLEDSIILERSGLREDLMIDEEGRWRRAMTVAATDFLMGRGNIINMDCHSAWIIPNQVIVFPLW